MNINDTELSYDIYSYDTLAVHGNKKKYHGMMKSLGGRWSSRLKIGDENGWIVPREKQGELDEIIMSQKFAKMERNAKPKNSQEKYHRAQSGSKHLPKEVELPKEVKEEVKEDEKSLEEIFQKKPVESEVLKHYKKFSKSPSPSPPVKKSKKSKKYESSSDEDSSDSDFPTYENRHKKKKIKKELKQVEEEMRYLKRKLQKLEKVKN